MLYFFYRGSQWNIDSFINGFANILKGNLNGGKLSRGLYYRAIDEKMSERAGIIVKSFRKGMLPGKEYKHIVTLKKLFPVLATDC